MRSENENTLVENVAQKIREHSEEMDKLLQLQEAKRNAAFNTGEQVIIFGRSRPETLVPTVLLAIARQEQEILNRRSLRPLYSS